MRNVGRVTGEAVIQWLAGHNSSNRNKKNHYLLGAGFAEKPIFLRSGSTNENKHMLLGILPSTTCISHTLYFCPILIVNPVLFSLQWNPFITIMGLQNCVGEGCTLSGVPL